MTTHDTEQATDAKVEELKILLPPEIGRYDNDAYQATLLRAYVPGILARLAASEKENADLRAKVPRATQDDIDCAIEVCRFSDATTVDVVKGGAIIAAHVAPIRAQLETAVGLVDTQSRHISAYHKIIDHLNARLISLDVDYFPSRQDFWETIKATKGIQENAARFLATIPTAEGENES